MKRSLGIDVGSKRIGVALSDELGWMAQPLQTLLTSPQSPQEIAMLAEQHAVSVIVIGLPRNMNGTYGPAAAHCREFSKKVEALTKIKVLLWDERLTTAAATRSLHQAGLKTKAHRAIIDQVAAQEILQSWMDSGALLGGSIMPVEVEEN
ncbi:MAG: Holliday junction resolvase RuvX [Chthoniobacterales bacterium]|nr:Holliday junction resolvase RuvX [Chthoniobacterales bacterium]